MTGRAAELFAPRCCWLLLAIVDRCWLLLVVAPAVVVLLISRAKRGANHIGFRPVRREKIKK